MLHIICTIQTSVKTFVETVHKELEAKEKYVQNHEAWHHLFDIPTNRKGSESIYLDYEITDSKFMKNTSESFKGLHSIQRAPIILEVQVK